MINTNSTLYIYGLHQNAFDKNSDLNCFNHIDGNQLLLGIPFFNLLDHCDVLRDLVTFVQFKKREKHPVTLL